MLVVYDCMQCCDTMADDCIRIYAHVSDSVKWHRPRVGAWRCLVVYDGYAAAAALAGWGYLGVWWCMDCVCSVCSGVQGQSGVACASVVVVYQNTDD